MKFISSLYQFNLFQKLELFFWGLLIESWWHFPKQFSVYTINLRFKISKIKFISSLYQFNLFQKLELFFWGLPIESLWYFPKQLSGQPEKFNFLQVSKKRLYKIISTIFICCIYQQNFFLYIRNFKHLSTKRKNLTHLVLNKRN